MTNKIETYPAYKDSGVEWLGEIPSPWKKMKLKLITTIYNGDSLNENKKAKYESDDKNHIAYISSKDIDLGTSNISYKNGLRIPKNEPNYKVAKSNSSLICIEGGSAGRKIAFTNQDVCLVNKLACISPKNNIHSKFIYYTLKGSLFQTQFKLAVSGVIGGVAISSINNFYTLIPPLPEQTAIAIFLDSKTTLIDQAIGIKQRQIELLKERRQILIHKAVTRGLNPNVKLKDSGVEWIGEIPEEWEVKRLASFGKFSKGGGFSKADLTESGASAILYGDIYTKYDIQVKKGVRFISNLTAKKSVEVKKGNLLFTGSGETMEDIGKCVVFSSDKVTVAGGDVIIFEQYQNDSLYLSYVLNTEGAKFEKAKYSKGEIIVHTYGSKLKDIYIPIPPIAEQKEITQYIEISLTKIATTISLKEQEIEKLKEYKATLINSAVTGKIKVI